MALFNPLIPYDDELRRRLAERPPVLPNIGTPRPRPLPTRGMSGATLPTGMPGAPSPSPFPETAVPDRMPMPTRTPATAGGTPMPVMKQPTRGEQITEARDVYLQGTPGRKKSGLLGALRGAGEGAREGDFAGALGGLIGGGLAGIINPRGQREAEFEERVRPKILEGFAYEDQDRAARAAAAKAASDQAMTQAQIANTNSQVESRAKADEMAQRNADRPLILNQGQVAVDPRTQRKVAENPATPKAPTDADLEQRFYEETGDTFESRSQKSLAGRIQAIKARLTADEQRLVFGGATNADDPQAIARAQSKWAKIQEDELNSIRRDTAARVKSQYRGSQAQQTAPRDSGRTTPRKGQTGRRAISVSEAAELLK